jgi:HTH-type transcriptional regulator / antitoxin MqsA
MQCPACGHPEMEEQNRDETLSYGGNSITIPNLRGQFCPNCDEGVWDTLSNGQLDEAQTRLIDAVRHKASVDIRRIRKKMLKLTQAKLAEHFGLGPLALSRYERGKTPPPLVLVKILRLLEEQPNLFEELKEMDRRDVPAEITILPHRNLVEG